MQMPKTSPAPTKKSAKPSKADRIKGRIAKLEATIEKYEKRRQARHEKLAALKTLLAKLSK